MEQRFPCVGYDLAAIVPEAWKQEYIVPSFSQQTKDSIATKMMKKILVIEDEAQTRDIYLECLEAEGFNAIGAENGRIGLQRAQEQLPDLVICDIMMPELDGYSVLTTLRQNPITATIPVIFLTAKTTEAERRYGIELGADDYLNKPCTAEDLLRAIANVRELTRR